MTIQHHPSDPTLASFAAGTLDEGRSLVVATHLSKCPACREAIAAFEGFGGAMLEDAEPLAVDETALARALGAISAHAPATVPATAPAPEPRRSIAPELPAALPAALGAYPMGAWRWIGPGVYWRHVGVPADEGTRVFMLKAAPGIVLPDHRHTGIEWTCILQGAFRHQHGRFGEGDFDEADETVEHHPVVEHGIECVCLVAMQGDIRFKSWIGRAIQSFVRI